MKRCLAALKSVFRWLTGNMQRTASPPSADSAPVSPLATTAMQRDGEPHILVVDQDQSTSLIAAYLADLPSFESCVGEIAEDQQLLLKARFQEHLSLGQIAYRLQTDTDTAARLLYQAVAALTDVYEARVNLPSAPEEASPAVSDDPLCEAFIKAEMERFHGSALWSQEVIETSPDTGTRRRIAALLHTVQLLALMHSQNGVPPGPTVVISHPDSDDSEPIVDSATLERLHTQHVQQLRNPPEDLIGTEVSQYEITGIAGVGGFGTVYIGRDQVLQREVAIKVPRLETEVSPSARSAFLHEARASALLDHPNLTAVYETVETPLQAIIYEFCDAGTLQDFVSKYGDQTRREEFVCDLMIRLCEGLKTAHTRGILHRDIKPANILMHLASADRSEAAVRLGYAFYIPKLTDFGLARIPFFQDHLAGPRQLIIGTPGFMSPEHATGRIREIGTHSDVYSLGAVMFWLLTGRAPVPTRGTNTQAASHSQCGPPAVSTLRPDISRQLDMVCRKCLHPDFNARYSSAGELLEDLTALRRKEPTIAGPATLPSLFRRYRRQHPLMAAVLGFLLVAAAGWLVLEYRHFHKQKKLLAEIHSANQRLGMALASTTQARAEAVREATRYQKLLYVSEVRAAAEAYHKRDYRTCFELLKTQVPGAVRRDFRDADWWYLWKDLHARPLSVYQTNRPIYHVTFSADQSLLALCGADGVVQMFDADTLKERREFQASQGELNCVAFSPDNHILATAGDDGTVVLWDLKNGRRILSVNITADKAFSVVFSPDGTCFYTCGDDPTIECWDTTTGERRRALTEHERTVENICLSDDGRFLLSASSDSTRGLFDLQTGRILSRRGSGHRVSDIECRCQGERCIAVYGTIGGRNPFPSRRYVEVVSDDLILELPSTPTDVQSVAISPDGNHVAFGLRDGVIECFDISAAVEDGNSDSARSVGHWIAHEGRVYGLAFRKDGCLFSAGADGKLHGWPDALTPHSTDGITFKVPNGATLDPGKASVSVSGTLVAAPTEGGQIFVADTEQHHPQFLENVLSDGELPNLLINPTEQLFAAWNEDQIAVYPTTRNSAADTLKALWSDALPVEEVAWDKSGKTVLVATATTPPRVELRDGRTGSLLTSFTPENRGDLPVTAIAHDGEQQLAVGIGNQIRIYHLQTGKLNFTGKHESSVNFVDFHSPNQKHRTKWLISAGAEGTVCIWDLQTETCVKAFRGHERSVERVVISARGGVVMSQTITHRLYIWNLQTATRVLTLEPEIDFSIPAIFPTGIGWVRPHEVVVQKLLQEETEQLSPSGFDSNGDSESAE